MCNKQITEMRETNKTCSKKPSFSLLAHHLAISVLAEHSGELHKQSDICQEEAGDIQGMDELEDEREAIILA